MEIIMKKKILCIALVSTMALSLAACGDSSSKKASTKSDVSVSEVVKKMNEASKNTKGSDITGTIDMSASMEEEGESYEMTVSGTMDVQATNDPVVSHMTTDMEMNMAGFAQPMKMEMYTVQDDNGTTTYTNQTGEWTKTTVDAEDVSSELTDAMSDISKYITDENIKKYFKDVKKKEEKKSGKDCYVVSGSLKETAFEDLFEAAKDITGEAVDTSELPEISMPIKFYVDKKTYLPVEVTVNMKIGEIEGVKFDKFEIKMTSNSYDVEEITIPDEVLNAPEESYSFDEDYSEDLDSEDLDSEDADSEDADSEE